MPKGILGKKLGMTHIFTESGDMITVSVIEAGPCPVLAVRGGNVQLGFDPVKKEKNVNKPLAGYFKKRNIAPLKLIRELKKQEDREYKIGEQITVELFKEGDFVDVIGTSIGKGFQGGMKRWNWSGTSQTHGSTSHRRIGSLGASTTPGRVWKGQHLPGHMGARRVTVSNLKVAKIDAGNNLILIEGAVPGPKNNYVVIQKAKKKKAKNA